MIRLKQTQWNREQGRRSTAAELLALRSGDPPAAFPVRAFTLQEEEQRDEVCPQKDDQPGRGAEVKVRRHGADRDLTLLLLSAGGGWGGAHLRVQDGDGASVFDFSVSVETSCCRLGSQSLLVTQDGRSLILLCQTKADRQNICELLWKTGDADGKRGEKRLQDGRSLSPGKHAVVRAARMQEAVAGQDFMFHGCLSQQQNLLQDYQRTASYQRAVLTNEADFRDKVVLSVGGGSGILSFFAVQAGAKRVYAVETGPMAEYLRILLEGNRLSERISVLEGRVEEVTLRDAVDVVVSEPIGYMLLHERKLDSFLFARKWLKPHGSRGVSINLCGLHAAAVNEALRQPIVDTFDMQVLMAASAKHRLDFLEDEEETLHRIEIPFEFRLLQSGLVHGLAFWFDVAFSGSTATVWFSTAPTEPLTHWYQVRCLLQTPLFAELGQTLSGRALLTTNHRHSYDIQISATVDQSGFRSGNILDLKNPFFRMPSWLHD